MQTDYLPSETVPTAETVRSGWARNQVLTMLISVFLAACVIAGAVLVARQSNQIGGLQARVNRLEQTVNDTTQIGNRAQECQAIFRDAPLTPNIETARSQVGC